MASRSGNRNRALAGVDFLTLLHGCSIILLAKLRLVQTILIFSLHCDYIFQNFTLIESDLIQQLKGTRWVQKLNFDYAVIILMLLYYE